jgi:hypothetical protein
VAAAVVRRERVIHSNDDWLPISEEHKCVETALLEIP